MTVGSFLLVLLKVLLRLLVPLAAVLAVYFGAYVTQWSYVTIFDAAVPASEWWLTPGYWLTLGHFVIMLAFFVVILANRAFGPVYALAPVVLLWLLLGAALGALMPALAAAFPGSPLPPQKIMIAFLAALGLAHVVGVVVFDRLRGKPWWRAPLASGIASALVMAAVYWPLAKAQGSEPWLSRMFIDFTLKAMLAAAFLLPYALLRPVIKPQDGFGGY